MTLIDVPGQAQSCSAPAESIVWGCPGTPIQTWVSRLKGGKRPPWGGPTKCVDQGLGNSLWKEDASPSSPPVRGYLCVDGLKEKELAPAKSAHCEWAVHDYVGHTTVKRQGVMGAMAREMETGGKANHPNRLVREKSPYLLQHAHNPVDWYAWGEEAFDRARRENRPIFLSIGYSTCHWCHVMEKESFEDKEVATLMNETFVSIKVDREERPDLDHVYMAVCQMLTGSGGWPLTIVMTPDKRPFFAATYIPRESRFGRAGMLELIPQIRGVWTSRHKEVQDSATSITAALHAVEQDTSGKRLDEEVLHSAYLDLAKRFDGEFGGFSGAPKFPTPHNFFFLPRYWKRTGNEKALEMVEKTLQAMRRGGIHDQVGYGFHRYSTDRKWLVPHFEKMLYDQAMLALAYIDAYQASGKDFYGRSVHEIFTYVLRDMTSPEGGFFSAEDADSEGVEGKFYLWKEEEIREILDREDADLILRVFNVTRDGNFREEATGSQSGNNILHLPESISRIASSLAVPERDLEERIRSARERLFEARERRVHPHKDDKVLTDWNGLMIAALARGAQALGEPRYAGAARSAAEFILKTMRTPEGRLLHRYRKGEAGITANLDDYAFFIWGLIDLYQATFDAQYLKAAVDLNEDMLKHFGDEEGGGLFFTPDDGEKLIVRKKEVYDGAVPSGNAAAMWNLLRLSRLTGRHDLEDKAAGIGKEFSGQIRQFPSGYTQFLSAADYALGPSYEVVLCGATNGKDTAEMLRALRRAFLPNMVAVFRPSEEAFPAIDEVAPFVKHYTPVDGKATAYVCRGNTCSAPTTDIVEMLRLLSL